MINILIVDDDSTIRMGIKKIISDSCLKNITLFEAENGLKAIEVVCSYKIDLIIADIKMPVCTGIEMMEKLLELKYKGKFIVLSGFDDYDLVRTAMKLGAVDYLLKPIVVDEFICALDKIFNIIEEQNKLGNFSSKDNIKDILKSMYNKQLILEKLLLSNVNLLETLPDFFNGNNLSLESKALFSAMDVFSNYTNLENDRLFWFSIIENVFLDIFADGDCILIQGKYDNLWCMIIIMKEKSKISPRLFDMFIKRLREHGKKVESTDKYYSISELIKAKNLCKSLIERHFYNLPNVNSSLIESYPYRDTILQLVDYICQCDFVGFSNYVTDFLYVVNAERPQVDQFKQLLINSVYSIMSKNNKYIGIVAKYKFTENDIITTIQESRNLMSLRASIINIFSIYINDVKDQSGPKDDYIIQKAKFFIENEYMNDVSLNDVSSKLCIHPNYFSSLFKKKSGITYREYLRSLRIEKAIELLKTSDLKLYEISEKVGYKDTAHFNRAFKEVTGKSPSDYRKEM